MEFNICDYGAVGNGSVSNTKAFKEAVSKAATWYSENAKKNGASECENKRAVVLVPDGIWLTGPIELMSNVELRLSDNALILFDKNSEEYPIIVTDYEGVDRLRTVSPLYAVCADNIAVTGGGTIDGNGHLWRPVKQFKMTERQWKKLLSKSEYVVDSKEGGIWMPSETSYKGREVGEFFPDEEDAVLKATPYYDFYRPTMVNFKHCTNVEINGVRVQNSPAWAIHLYFCKNVKVLNVSVENPYWAQNGDGIDIESCDGVEVAYSKFHVGDDGVCIKSGKNAKAREIAGPSQNIYVHHCYVGQSHGGFVIGSEMSRGVRNVVVEDCTFIDSDVGVRFKSALGRGGVVENITIKRINMVNIKEQGFIFTMDYVHTIMDYVVKDSLTENESDVPFFKDIHISDCNCIGAEVGIKIKGLDGRDDTISDITFENCNIVAKKDIEMACCRDIHIN